MIEEKILKRINVACVVVVLLEFGVFLPNVLIWLTIITDIEYVFAFLATFIILLIVLLLLNKKRKDLGKYLIAYYKNLEVFDRTFSYITGVTIGIKKKIFADKYNINIDNFGFSLQRNQISRKCDWSDYEIKIEEQIYMYTKFGREVKAPIIKVHNEKEAICFDCNPKNYYLFLKYSKKKINFEKKDKKRLKKLLGDGFENEQMTST